MRLSFAGDRVLAVVAHPDDAELLCAGTLARARDDGAAIGICVLCRGDRGQPAEAIPDLDAVRRTEMEQSAGILGAELYLGGVGDGTLADGPDSRALLTGILRAFQPTLVLAHSPEDYHPDHQAASALAAACTWFAASRGFPADAPPLESAPALWWMDTVNMTGFAPGFYVDVSAQAQLKRRMLACHESQLQRSGDGDFAPLAELMERQMTVRGAECGATAAEAFRLHTAFKRIAAW